MKQIPLIRPYLPPGTKERVCAVLDSGYLTEGPATREFETVFKNYVGAAHALEVCNCTVGLEVALRALGIGPGDEVIVPDYTYPATASVVDIVGATTVLVDVNRASMLVDYEALAAAVTPRTKAVIPVSIFGNPLDYGVLNALKAKHGFAIIEDAACSIGAAVNGQMVGSQADISVFSLHPRKFVTTGEGGMITTSHAGWAEWMDSYKHFGMASGLAAREGIVFQRIGTNYKLSNILSAVGLSQMLIVDELLHRRRELAARYDAALAGIPGVTLPTTVADGRHSYQTYCVFVERRDEVMTRIRELGIEVQIGTYSLHRHPAYQPGPRCRWAGSAGQQSVGLRAFPRPAAVPRDDRRRTGLRGRGNNGYGVHLMVGGWVRAVGSAVMNGSFRGWLRVAGPEQKFRAGAPLGCQLELRGKRTHRPRRDPPVPVKPAKHRWLRTAVSAAESSMGMGGRGAGLLRLAVRAWAVVAVGWLGAAGVCLAQPEPWTQVAVPAQYQSLILKIAFTESLVTGQALAHPAVTNLDGLKTQLEGMLVNADTFTNTYRDLVVGAAVSSPITYGITTERLRLSFTLGRPFDAHAYVRRSTNNPPGAARMAVLVIPGGGADQSSLIARADLTDADNYHKDIAAVTSVIGDTFILVKPNEDFLAIHDGVRKLNGYFVYTGLIDQGGSYSALYLTQALALAKYLQQNYDGLTVVGLSQGGAATLLVALQASPTAAVVASGYSILQDQVNYAGFEQILIPKIRVTFGAARVRELMASNLTSYLFTWGRNEGDVNKLEADLGPTAAYFASVPSFRAQVHDGGREFAMPAVAGYLAEQLRRLRFRATAVISSGNHFSTTWNGLQVARSYEVQASSNFLTWESVRRLTNGEASLYFEHVPGVLEPKRFFRLRELP